MSLTTRCPACSTRFRVVPDQLKISDGWVRCGHCSNVFDATLHLSASLMLSPAAPQPQALPPQIPPQIPVPDPVPEPAPPPTSPPPPPPRPPEPEPVVQADPVSPAAPADDPVSDFHAALQAFAQHSAAQPLDLDLSSHLPADPPVDGLDPTDVAPAAAALATAAPEPAAPDAAPRTDPDVDADPPEAAAIEPGFMRQARRQAFWRSAPVRAVLLVLVLVLSALLAGQWAVQQRSWIAARYPALKPHLVQACDMLGCEVEPLRRIDAIVIDSATLVRRLGQFHSFDIVLQNTADLPLAAPALELSLTDVGDRVIARRVFLPSEWPEAVTELPPRATVPVSFRLSIASSDDLPMAGYRALVFYP